MTASLSFLHNFSANCDTILWDNSFCSYIFTQICTLQKFAPHHSLGYWDRRSFALRVFMKSIMLTLVYGFTQILSLSTLSKQASFYLCFRRKPTLLKEVWISFQQSICNSNYSRTQELQLQSSQCIYRITLIQSMVSWNSAISLVSCWYKAFDIDFIRSRNHHTKTLQVRQILWKNRR